MTKAQLLADCSHNYSSTDQVDEVMEEVVEELKFDEDSAITETSDFDNGI